MSQNPSIVAAPRAGRARNLLMLAGAALLAACGRPPSDPPAKRVSAVVQLGDPAVLSIEDSGNGDTLQAQRVQLGAPGTLQSLSFYVPGTPAGTLRLGVYDANAQGFPGAKKAETAEITPVTGWNTANVTSPVALAPGRYWLAQLPSDNALHSRRVGDEDETCVSYSYAYGPLPATFDTSPAKCADHWSFYATLDGPTPLAIGELTALSQVDSGNSNYLQGQKVALGQASVVQSLSFYVSPDTPSESGTLRLGIYDATGATGRPGAKKAETAEFTPVKGWNTVAVTTPTLLAAGDYWLAHHPSSDALRYRQTTTGGPRGWVTRAYGPMPSTFGAIADEDQTDGHWSMYATLTPPPARAHTLTIDHAGYAGTICVLGFGCDTTFDLAAGTYTLWAETSVDSDITPFTHSMGTFTVDANQVITPGSGVFKSFDWDGTSTLTAKTVTVEVERDGFTGQGLAWGGAGGVTSAPTMLVVGRRYALRDTASRSMPMTLDQADYSPDGYGVTVTDAGIALDPATALSFEPVTMIPRKIKALTTSVLVNLNGFAGQQISWFLIGGVPPGTSTPTKLIKNRRYGLQDGASREWDSDSNMFSDNSYGVGINPIGASPPVVLDNDTKESFELSDPTTLRAKVREVYVNFNGFTGAQLSWAFGAGLSPTGPPSPTKLIAGRRYSLRDGGSRRVGTDDSNYSSASYGVTVNPLEPDQPPPPAAPLPALALDEDMKKSFDLLDTTLTAKVKSVKAYFNGFTGHAVNWYQVKGLTPPSDTVLLIPNRRYGLRDSASRALTVDDEMYEPGGYGVNVHSDYPTPAPEPVTREPVTAQSFRVSGSDLIARTTHAVIRPPTGYSTPVCVNDSGCASVGADLVVELVVNRRYTVQESYLLPVDADGNCPSTLAVGGATLQVACNANPELSAVQVDVKRLIAGVPVAVPNAQVDVYQGASLIDSFAADQSGVASIILPGSGPYRFRTLWGGVEWWSSTSADCSPASCLNKTITVTGVDVTIAKAGVNQYPPGTLVSAYSGPSWSTLAGSAFTGMNGTAQIGLPAGVAYRFLLIEGGYGYWSPSEGCTVAGCSAATITVNACNANICQQGTCVPDPVAENACKLTPTLSCVVDRGNGSYTALFGYTSTAADGFSIRPPHPANTFSPAPVNRGQPQGFTNGNHANVFALDFSQPVTWTLGSGSVTASSGSPRCTDAQRDAANKSLLFDPAAAMAGTATSPGTVTGAVPLFTGGTAGTTLAGDLGVNGFGQASYSIPIQVPAGRRGIQPSLSLVYSSGDRSNGTVGIGWSLAGLSAIHRCNKSIHVDGSAGPVRMKASDAFCLGGQRLVAVGTSAEPGFDGPPSSSTVTYRTEVDSYARIQSGPFESTGPRYFEVSTLDGKILTYGYKDQAMMPFDTMTSSTGGNRYAAVASFTVDQTSSQPDGPSYSNGILDWPLTEVRDRFGNAMTISYQAIAGTYENGHAFERWPTEIRYTSHPSKPQPLRSVKFRWAEQRTPTGASRIDAGVVRFRGGVKVTTTRLLESIDVWAPNPSVPGLIRSYQLTYQTSPSTARARLTSVKECDGSASPVCSQPTTFGYTDPVTGNEYEDPVATPINLAALEPGAFGQFTSTTGFQTVDINGDGLDDIAFITPVESNGSGTATYSGKATYFLSNGSNFDLASKTDTTGTHPDGSLVLSASQPLWVDIDGDGKPEMGPSNFKDPESNVFYRVGAPSGPGAAAPLTPYESPASSPPRNPSRLLVPADLNGDGLSEFVDAPAWPSISSMQYKPNLGGVLQPLQTFVAADNFSATQKPWVVDVDGDGRDEILVLRVDGPKRYAYGLATAGSQAAAPAPTTIRDAPVLWFADVNGDGLDDVVRFRETDPVQSPGIPPDLTVQINTGNGFLPEVAVRTYVPFDAYFPSGCYPDSDGGCHYLPHRDTGVRIADIDGDGADELILMDNGRRHDNDSNARSAVTVIRFERQYDPTTQAETFQVVGRTLQNVAVGRDANGIDGVGFQTGCVQPPLYLCDPMGNSGRCIHPLIFSGTATQYCLTLESDPPRPHGYNMSRTLDVNGDGLIDLVDVDPATTTVRLHIRRGPRPDLLKEVTRGNLDQGFGARVEVTYKPITDKSRVDTQPQRPPSSDEIFHSLYEASASCGTQACLRKGMWVVSEVLRDNGLDHSNWLRTTYSYRDGRLDRSGHGFLGFKDRWEQTERSEPMGTVFTTKHQAYPIDPADFIGAGPYHAGRPNFIDSYVTRLDGQGAGVSHRTNQRIDTDVVVAEGLLSRKYVDLVQRNVETTTSEVVLPDYVTKELAHTLVIREPDTFHPASMKLGRVGSVRAQTFGAGGAIIREDITTVLSYHPDDTTSWIIGPPKDVQVSSTIPGRTPPPPRLRRSDYDLSTLFLKSVATEPDSGTADERVTVTYQPTNSGTGLVASVTTTAGNGDVRTGSFGYDALEEIHVQDTTDALGRKRTVITHPGLGLTAFERDPNGVVVGYQYDTLGRLLKMDNPDGLSDVTTELFANPLRVRTTRAGAPVTYAYFDRLGRTNKSETQMSGGAWSAVVSQFDALGRRFSVTPPHVSGGPLPGLNRTIVFDEIGRPLQVRGPNDDGAEVMLSEFAYDGLTATSYTPPASSTRTERDRKDVTLDRFGNVAKSVEWLDDHGLKRSVATEFDYVEFGLLRESRVRVDNGTPLTTSVTYDRLGRRKTLTTPDTGTRTTFYNGLGEIRREEDVDGNDVVYERDVLGRVFHRTVDKAGVRLEDATWRWDAPNAMGAIESTLTQEQTATSFEYDPLGRPIKTRRRIAGANEIVLEQTYDPIFGRPDVTSYPDVAGWSRLQVQRSYDSTGALTGLTRLDTTDPIKRNLWHASSFDAWGHITQESLGGAVTSRTFDPDTGHLTAIESHQVASGAAISNISYGYYDNGNVRFRGDGATGDFQLFEHDSLDRLVTWQQSNMGATEVPGGWEVDYGYDEVGNLKSRTTTAGGQAQTATYGYGGPNAGPHAVTSWNISGAGQPGSSGTLGYDQLGRMTSHSRLGTVTYSSFDLPLSITDGSGTRTFRYDADGVRVLKQDGSGTTVYAGLYELRTPPGGGAKEHVFYLSANSQIGQIVRSEADGSEKTLYFHQDHLGSVTKVADQNGVVEQKRTDPYGAKIVSAAQPFLQTGDINPSAAGVRVGFGGHEEDESLGLVNMGGRIYDPLLGRFLTPDPVNADPLSAQSHNSYSYVGNAPLRFVDPTGFVKAEGCPTKRFGGPWCEGEGDDDDDDDDAPVEGDPVSISLVEDRPLDGDPVSISLVEDRPPDAPPGECDAACQYEAARVAITITANSFVGFLPGNAGADRPVGTFIFPGGSELWVIQIPGTDILVPEGQVHLPSGAASPGDNVPGAIRHSASDGGYTWNLNTNGVAADSPVGNALLGAAAGMLVRGVAALPALVRGAAATRGFAAIKTPYGPAAQALSKEALATRTAVEQGATLYKGGRLGVSTGPEAQFWSLENPLAPGYAQKFGIPPGNAAFDFVETATLKPGAGFIVRPAPGFGPNAGGALEVVVKPGGVQLRGFTMP